MKIRLILVLILCSTFAAAATPLVKPVRNPLPPDEAIQLGGHEVLIIKNDLPAKPAPKNPDPKEGAVITLTGKLHGGIMAIGGETTGWRLSYTTKQGPKTIEVDMSVIKKPDEFDGKQVTITGKTFMKNYVERGKVLILKAATVKPLK